MMMGILADKTLSQGGGSGTVTVNATGTELYQGSNVSTIDYTGLTVAAGSSTAIVALWMLDDNAGPPTSVTAVWDPTGANQALTQIVQGDNTGEKSCFIFGLAGEHGAVATGNKTLRLSWTGAAKFMLVAMAFDGVNQTGGATSFPNSTSANAGGIGLSTVSVTSATGNKVIACETASSSQGTSTGTQIFNDNSNGTFINAMSQYDDGAATVVIGNSGNNRVIAATDIKAA